jgi:hypothetical protein
MMTHWAVAAKITPVGLLAITNDASSWTNTALVDDASEAFSQP